MQALARPGQAFIGKQTAESPPLGIAATLCRAPQCARGCSTGKMPPCSESSWARHRQEVGGIQAARFSSAGQFVLHLTPPERRC